MRGTERAWVLGFVAVVCVGCGGSRATPLGMGGTSGATGGAGGITAGAGGVTSGAGGITGGAGGVTDGGTDASGPDGGGVGGHIPGCTGPGGLCTDFPVDPIVETGVSTSLCAAPSGPAPCIVEPQDGTMFPGDWLPARVNVQGLSGPMKIIFHSDREANDLVVYAASNTWTMPRAIWQPLSNHVLDSPITVAVCGASGGQSMSKFTIAPAFATGEISFVAADPTYADVDEHACQTSLTASCASAVQLRGFSPGDTTTLPLLGISQVQQPSRLDSGGPAPVTCIGCHSRMPEANYVTFVDSYPWRAATALLEVGLSTGAPFPTVSSSGLASLQQQGWGRFSFHLPLPNAPSPYWQPGMRIGIGALGLGNPLVPQFDNGPDQNDSPHLAWFNLEAAPRTPQAGDNVNWAYANYDPNVSDISSGNSLGFVQHTGDMCGTVPCGAAMPTWSHDGSKIVYVSTNAALSGRLNQENPNPGPGTGATIANTDAQRVPGLTNLYVVPFNNGSGGEATPIAGAATTTAEEYYPDLSPDDQFVAFTRVPAGEHMYLNSHAEIYLAPLVRGSAIRLVANDPPACSGKISPGVNNNWARFAPDVTYGTRGVYYWLLFSSTRANLPPGLSSKGRTIPIQQLYLAPIIISETNVITYPAIYLWNQPTDTVNITPEWVTYTMP